MRLINGLLTLALAISLFSCGSSGEEFFLNPDGSGRVVANTDLSSMWGLMQMGLQAELGKDEDRDPAAQQMLEMLTAENFDTTFSFVDFMSNIAEAQGGAPVGIGDLLQQLESNPDMTEEQRESLIPLANVLATTEMRLFGEKASNNYGLASTQFFTNLEEMVPLAEGFGGLGAMAGETGDPEAEMGLNMMGNMMGESTTYRLEGNMLYVSRPPAPETDEDMDPQMAMAMQMFGGDSEDFVLTLHLPGKIKKVSREAEIDKKAGLVTVTIPAAEVENGFDFNVKFKPRRR
ncbi:MAG: hypothetical protein AAF433_03580 [Bacteroidota bacterium]